METMIDQIEVFDMGDQDAINAFLHELAVNIMRSEVTNIKVGASNIVVHYKVPISELETEGEDN